MAENEGGKWIVLVSRTVVDGITKKRTKTQEN
jgi:hypothetical protein